LRLKNMLDGIQQLLVQGAVLAFEVQHGHRLSGWGVTRQRGGSIFHETMVPAAQASASHGPNGECGLRGEWRAGG
jgi:hypothetical protein